MYISERHPLTFREENKKNDDIYLVISTMHTWVSNYKSTIQQVLEIMNFNRFRKIIYKYSFLI